MIISRTPLRISFAGGGTDLQAFYGRERGAVLSSAIDKYVYITVNRKFDDKVRASYQAMGPADEPPYPLEGMAPLMQKLQKGAELFKVSGQVDMAIEIAADGSPHDVTVYSQAGTAQFTQFVASVLAMTRYKPGVCGGHACTMAFPLQVTFSRG